MKINRHRTRNVAQSLDDCMSLVFLLVRIGIRPYDDGRGGPYHYGLGVTSVLYSQGCHAGSIRHKLSGLVAAAIRVVTLVSPPSY